MKRSGSLSELGIEGTHFSSSSDPRVQALVQAGIGVPNHVLQEMEYQLSLPGRRLAHARQVQTLETHGLGGRLAARVWNVIGRPRDHVRTPSSARAAREHLKVHHDLRGMEMDLGVNAPLRSGSLKHLGINETQFLSAMSPVFKALPYDLCDVKRRWIEALRDADLQAFESSIPLLRAYYSDPEADFPETLISLIPTEEKMRLESLQPWRRRGLARFKITSGEDDQMEAQLLPAAPFEQPEGDEIRSWPRNLPDLPPEVAENPILVNFILGAVQYVKEVDHTVLDMEITLHFMGVTARANQVGDNAPEGAHQDGADYIFSALVIDRENIEGGESVLFLKDPEGHLTEIYRDQLEPGQWLFQADQASGELFGTNNTLYHTVTPFTTKDPSQEGSRNIIGLDIKVTRRNP